MDTVGELGGGDFQDLPIAPDVGTAMIQAFSRELVDGVPTCDTGLPAAERPASFVWMVSGISIEEECDVKLDKQVSCDGGLSFVDVGFDDDVAEVCTGWTTGPPEVVVRYNARTNVGSGAAVGELADCVLTDPGVLDDPVGIGTLAGMLENETIFETDLLECNAELEAAAGEATLTCTCFEAGSGIERSGSDTALVECQTPGVDLEKSCEDLENGDSRFTMNVTNIGDAPLAGCVVTDAALGFASAPFDLAPGGLQTFTEDSSLLRNEATVVCTIVGSGGKTVTDTDASECCPELTLDKQVSL